MIVGRRPAGHHAPGSTAAAGSGLLRSCPREPNVTVWTMLRTGRDRAATQRTANGGHASGYFITPPGFPFSISRNRSDARGIARGRRSPRVNGHLQPIQQSNEQELRHQRSMSARGQITRPVVGVNRPSRYRRPRSRLRSKTPQSGGAAPIVVTNPPAATMGAFTTARCGDTRWTSGDRSHDAATSPRSSGRDSSVSAIAASASLIAGSARWPGWR